MTSFSPPVPDSAWQPFRRLEANTALSIRHLDILIWSDMFVAPKAGGHMRQEIMRLLQQQLVYGLSVDIFERTKQRMVREQNGFWRRRLLILAHSAISTSLSCKYVAMLLTLNGSWS